MRSPSKSCSISRRERTARAGGVRSFQDGRDLKGARKPCGLQGPRKVPFYASLSPGAILRSWHTDVYRAPTAF